MGKGKQSASRLGHFLQEPALGALALFSLLAWLHPLLCLPAPSLADGWRRLFFAWGLTVAAIFLVSRGPGGTGRSGEPPDG